MLARTPGLTQAKSSEAEAVHARERPTTDQVFREHGLFVLRLLRRLGVADADVEDVLQDVFMTIHRALATYEERDMLRSWLYSICVRAAARSRQRRGRHPTVDIDEVDVSHDDTPEDALRTREARADLERLLDVLDPPRREIFVLFEIEELTMEEVTSIVGCPLATGYSRLRAARKEVIAAARRLSAQRRNV